MARPIYHVPDEIYAMYEPIAKDVDVVLIDVLVPNLEEPRASGGGKQSFKFFVIHSYKNA
jgi:hypothetical protein